MVGQFQSSLDHRFDDQRLELHRLADHRFDDHRFDDQRLEASVPRSTSTAAI
jgi:hypothetical protein